MVSSRMQCATCQHAHMAEMLDCPQELSPWAVSLPGGRLGSDGHLYTPCNWGISPHIPEEDWVDILVQTHSISTWSFLRLHRSSGLAPEAPPLPIPCPFQEQMPCRCTTCLIRIPQQEALSGGLTAEGNEVWLCRRCVWRAATR